MSRFVGQIGTRGDILKEEGGTFTGELIVPTTNTGSTEFVSLTRMCACVGPGNPFKSQCVITVFDGRCASAGSTNFLDCTWTVPTGVQRVFIQMWAGGGGGGRGCGPAGRGMGHPGGAGGYSAFTMCVNAGEQYLLRAGAGGTGLTYGGMGCQGDCSRVCGSPGIDVNVFGGQGGPACACSQCCAPGGGASVTLCTRMVPGSWVCIPGAYATKNGPWCACAGCCRPGNNRGGNAALGGWGASGTCRGRCHCSDSGGCWACSSRGGGGAGGTGHGSGQGLYSTPCCRGGRGGAGAIFVWI